MGKRREMAVAAAAAERSTGIDQVRGRSLKKKWPSYYLATVEWPGWLYNCAVGYVRRGKMLFLFIFIVGAGVAPSLKNSSGWKFSVSGRQS